MAYVPLRALRHIGLAHARLVRATCATSRLALLEIGSARIGVRHIKTAMATGSPCKAEFHRHACAKLATAAHRRHGRPGGIVVPRLAAGGTIPLVQNAAPDHPNTGPVRRPAQSRPLTPLRRDGL